MMIEYWISLCIVVSVLLFIWRTSQTTDKVTQLINEIPGPPTIPLLGNLHQIAFVPSERVMNIEIEHCAQHGRIFRTWFGHKPVIHLLKGEYIESLLNSSKHLEKGDFYNLLHPWLGTGLLTSKGEKWFVHRKMITPTFHFKILESFIDVYNDNIQILVDKIREHEQLDKQFNIYPLLTRCALDIISETAMGTQIHAQKQEDSPYVSAIYRVSELTVRRHFKFWLRPDIIFYNTSVGKEYVKSLEVLHSFTRNIIKERIALRKDKPTEEINVINDVGRKKKQAFLDLLLDANSSGVDKMSENDLREEVDTFMFEGHDTTTAATCWAVLLLAQHPKIQEEVYEELRGIFADDPTRHPTMQDLSDMKHLERVIKETLRLYPPVPFIIRKLDEDLKIGKYTIPEGTLTMVHIRQVHTDPEAFATPDQFNPDHFLPENTVNRHPYAYVPFSAGPRNCIGQKFAMLEEKAILSTLLRKFKFTTDVEYKLPIFDLVLRPQNGVMVRVESRM